MGKFDSLAKALGLALEKYGDDAAKILEKVDSPELATTLKGAERGEYLRALDDVYGDQAKRMSDMGFGPETYYHGTKQKFDQFNPSYGGSAGKGVYLTKDLNVAQNFKPEGGAIFKGYIKDSGPIDFRSEEAIKAAASKLGIENEFNGKRFRSGNAFYDLFDAYEKKHPELFKGLVGTERENAFTKALQDEGVSSIKFSQNGIEDYATNVIDPKNIRSSKAAFDPRFKNSALLMAGGLAAPMGKKVVDMNPLEDIKEGFGAYEGAKEKLARAFASQVNIGKNPNDEEYIKQAFKMGADPLNYVPGGAGLGLIQMGLESMPDKAKSNVIEKSLGKVRAGY